MKHLIVVRLGIKWLVNGVGRWEETGLSWEEWCKNSLELYNKYTRASLRRQTCQDFTLVSLCDETFPDVGKPLKNEIILRTSTQDKKDENGNIYFGKVNWKKAINNYFFGKVDPSEYILFTRLDRDDCLHNEYVELLHNCVQYKDKEFFIDITDFYVYDGKQLNLATKYRTVTSPYLTTYERINREGLIKGYPYVEGHTKIGTKLPGIKLDELKALRIIHENNLLNKMIGEPVLISEKKKKELLKEFGI